jgi:hypothetical protein
MHSSQRLRALAGLGLVTLTTSCERQAPESRPDSLAAAAVVQLVDSTIKAAVAMAARDRAGATAVTGASSVAAATGCGAGGSTGTSTGGVAVAGASGATAAGGVSCRSAIA